MYWVELAYYVLLLICVLVAVSFYTLYERKVLSYAHIRKGPMLVGWWGLMQPFSDAIKLFTKEIVSPSMSNFWVFYLMPLISVLAVLASWSVCPWSGVLFSYSYLIVLIFIFTAVGVYAHLGAGWGSNSKYAMIGALRCVAQSVSYEVSMAFLLICILFAPKTLNLLVLSEAQSYSWGVALMPVLLGVWIVSLLAETNRAPFDFAEGESELVSGFNIEYGFSGFALLFIGEYASMVFMSFLLSLLFTGAVIGSAISAGVICLFMFIFIWVRSAYPRSRYDKLMALCWILMLPAILMGAWCASVAY